MRIGVCGQPLLEQSAGITYYTRGILRELLRQDRKNRYDLLLFRLFPQQKLYMFGRKRNLEYRYQRFFPFKVFYKLQKWGAGIPLELFFGGHDLYLFPNFVVYSYLKGRSVVVIYDLTFEKVPQYVDRKNAEFLKKLVPQSVKRADHIITISEHAKKDIITAYGVAEDKITVIYPGVDLEQFKPSSTSDINRVKKRYGIKKPFILYLGTLEPRKNIPAILRAYAALKVRRDFALVLAGKKGWMYNEIFETVRDLGVEKDVIFPGYVPDGDKPHLLSAAEVFVFPSFFEGFGMPVVEAQACGTPVITSNTTSLPEAGGDAALYVDPNDTDALKECLEEILSSSSLRNDLSKAGFVNSRRFAWSDSARRLIQVFEGLSEQR